MSLTPEKVLAHIEKVNGTISSLDLAKEYNVDHQEVIGVLKSILCFENVLKSSDKTEDRIELTAEGKDFVQNGSYEMRVFKIIPAEGIKLDDLKDTAEFKALGKMGNIGFSKAMASKWIVSDKATSLVKRVENSPEDKFQNLLKDVQSIPAADLKECVKRKLVNKIVVKSLDVSKGSEFSVELTKKETDLTPEMLADGSWKTKSFKSFNPNALGVAPDAGALHPLLKVRAEYRQIFLEMGFEEMPTSKFIESSFWNFDSLFQPQMHPARDAHDTFFLTVPEKSDNFPEDYLQRVKNTHEKGGYGSQGYGYEWDREEARKNLLRTHTTAVSARMLYELAKEQPFKPTKYFSIDRVFRNETLDATHLAEFHQIEGVIADYNLTLGDLMGTLSKFFERLGMGSNLKFKPAFNPYTEPSMEIFSFHNGLNKWVEVGNSGMFRPEMLRPMNLPEDVVVIAWGLSLERPTMIKYGYDNIRDLVGPKVDMKMVRDNQMCRLDNE